MLSTVFDSSLILPIYQIPRYDSSTTLKVVIVGFENMGFFISEGFEGDPDVCISYFDFVTGIDVGQLECVGSMTLHELKNCIDQKLERFSWNNDVIKRMRIDVTNRIEEHKITMFLMNKSARNIQRKWRSCVGDPGYVMCRRRLMREYDELVGRRDVICEM